MKTFGSCHLIVNRNSNDDKCIDDFIDADCLGGAVLLLHF